MDVPKGSLADLKDYYPSVKSIPRSAEQDITKAENAINSKSGDSVVTIDLSDDSLIIEKHEDDTGNNSDDSLETLTNSPVRYKEKFTLVEDEVPSKYDSSDDSFLDIPLSQRIGLAEKTNKKRPKSMLQKERSDSIFNTECDSSWTKQDIVEDDFNKKITMEFVQVSPIKLTQSTISTSSKKLANKKSSQQAKKIEKRPYQSDTPPSIRSAYTSLKEKAPKTDLSSEPSDTDTYTIEETITPVRSNTRIRRTPEEKQKMKEEKEKRKAEREEARKAREKLKAKEKERNKAIKEAGRTKTLTDCHKFCTTYVDLKLLDFYKISDELQAMFREKDVPLVLDTDFPIESGVRWVREQREVAEEAAGDDATVNVVKKYVEADIILKVLHSSEFIPMAYSSINQINLISDEESESDNTPSLTLFNYVTNQLLKYDDKNLMLVLYGYEKYWSQQKNKENQEYRAQMGFAKKRVNKNKDTLPLVKKNDLDLALFDLQVKLSESPFSSRQVHIITTENCSDLCSIIWSHTRATAMAPIKQVQREQQGLEWFAQNDTFGSIDIQSDQDITSLWTKQLMTFSKMSMDMAKAISNVYPSLQALLTAYNQCQTNQEKEELLTSIEVSRNNYTNGTTSKKLGSQTSKRIFLFLTTRDGDTIID